MLGDEPADLDHWREDFESVCGLANNCRGLAPQEMLVALKSCLKQSRADVFANQMKAARASGELERDPRAVYDKIMETILATRETSLEVQSVLDKEWASDAGKGRRTAHQFHPVFQKLVTDMEACGLGKSERELFLGYLRRMTPQVRADILKWRAEFPDRSAGGAPGIRGPETWQEAHTVLVQLERYQDQSRSFVAKVDGDGSQGGRRSPKTARTHQSSDAAGGGKPEENLTAVVLPQHLKRVCYRACDN